MSTGPFGFEYGMTREQVINLVGETSVEPRPYDGILLLTTAPKPHPHFDSYVLNISPELGLLKVLAGGRTVCTTRFGDKLRDKFSEIRDALSAVYGKPQIYDDVRSGSIWHEEEDWMEGLLKTERTLESYWMADLRLPNHINCILLEAVALSTESGHLNLHYEFDGFTEYIEAQKVKHDQVF